MVSIGTVTGPGAGAGDLFQLFRDHQAFTKAQLAETTGLSRSTISARIDLLISGGLLKSAGEAVSSGGRPPARVEFNPLARVVVGADLGATHGLVALCDLQGAVLGTVSTEISIALGPETVLAWVVESITDLLAAGGFDPARLAGIGIGVPGPVEHSTGRATNPPIMPGWDAFDIPGFVGRSFAVPILVDNDVNILALGEHARVWPAIDDLVYVKVATGIGAGIISGGELQRGAPGTAGDIGHVRVPYNRRSPRDPDDDRDLEAIASGTAIARDLRDLGLPTQSSADAMDLVRSGNPTAIEATRQAGRELGEVLAIMVNVLNPSIIVIGGSVARGGEHLLAGVREVVYMRSMPLATQHLSIVAARSGDQAGTLGAAILVIQRVLSATAVDAMLAEA
ncbi:MAG: ROK family transcriptional regulator [Burkholderiaceae bacterium]|nr:ROK family transcriptional regulator [Microbacteriaceae bacterium]